MVICYFSGIVSVCPAGLLIVWNTAQPKFKRTCMAPLLLLVMEQGYQCWYTLCHHWWYPFTACLLPLITDMTGTEWMLFTAVGFTGHKVCFVWMRWETPDMMQWLLLFVARVLYWGFCTWCLDWKTNHRRATFVNIHHTAFCRYTTRCFDIQVPLVPWALSRGWKTSIPHFAEMYINFSLW